MLARRDGARLMATFYTPSPQAVAGWEWFIGLFVGAGMGVAEARTAVDTVFSYVNGFTIEEQARGGMAREDRDRGFQAGLDLIIAGIRVSASG
jgi:TetR/AcrR family tetracycline transcriptional repressor